MSFSKRILHARYAGKPSAWGSYPLSKMGKATKGKRWRETLVCGDYMDEDLDSMHIQKL